MNNATVCLLGANSNATNKTTKIIMLHAAIRKHHLRSVTTAEAFTVGPHFEQTVVFGTD